MQECRNVGAYECKMYEYMNVGWMMDESNVFDRFYSLKKIIFDCFDRFYFFFSSSSFLPFLT